MQRRDFITLLGVAAAACPLAARAQQRERVRRIGVLLPQRADDPNATDRITAFAQALQLLGWTNGRNLRLDYKWSPGSAAETRKSADELVALEPDVILTAGAAALTQLLQATRSVPIVFTLVADPVGAGLVDSLAHPGGNATGFMALEYSMGGKWLELLKELAPGLKRAAVLRDSTTSAGIGLFGAIQSAAPSLGVEISPINARDTGELERAIAAFARGANGGLIVTPSGFATVHKDLIIALAARHKLPGVYQGGEFVAAGGLAAYGPDILDHYRAAAGYVDRILKGEKPADLPVQAPTKYELAINLKAAKAIGLSVPPTLLARADEVIE
jgi:putative ABC transport system substrate-binding protein